MRARRVLQTSAILVVATVVACGDREATPTAVRTGDAAEAHAAFVPLPPYCTKAWVKIVSGDWADGTKWLPAGVPAASDTACLIAPGTFTVTATGIQHVARLVVGAVGATATLRLDATTVDAFFDVDSATTILSGSTLDLASDKFAILSTHELTNDGTVRVSEPCATVAPCSELAFGSFVNNGVLDLQAAARLAAGLNFSDVPSLFENNGSIVLTAPTPPELVFFPDADRIGRFLQKGGTIAGSQALAVRRGALSGDPHRHDLFDFSGGVVEARTGMPNTATLQLEDTDLSFAGPALTGAIRDEASIGETVFVTGPLGAGTHLILQGLGSYRFRTLRPIPTTVAGTLELRSPGGFYVFVDGVVNTGTIQVNSLSVFSSDSIENQGVIELNAELYVIVPFATLTNAGAITKGSPIGRLVMFPLTSFVAATGSIMTGDLILQLARLSGSGRVGDVISLGGTIAPGRRIGKLVATSVVLDAGSVLSIDVAGITPALHDHLVVTGDVHFGGTLSITTLAPLQSGECGQVLPIVTDGSTGGRGAFATVSGLRGLSPTRAWRLDDPTGALNLIGYDPSVPLGTSRDLVTVAEGGASDTLSLCLGSTAPTANVTVAVTDSLGDATATPAPVRFPLGSWKLPQLVTVTAVNDLDIEPPELHPLTLAVSSNDPFYAAIAVPVPNVTIIDDDGNADLSVAFDDVPVNLFAGQNFSFGARITNTGPTAITGGTFSFPLLTGMQFVNVAGTGCTFTLTSATCALDPLSPGTIQTIQLQVTPLAVGTFPNTIDITSHQPDPALTNNSATYTFVIK